MQRCKLAFHCVNLCLDKLFAPQAGSLCALILPVTKCLNWIWLLQLHASASAYSTSNRLQLTTFIIIGDLGDYHVPSDMLLLLLLLWCSLGPRPLLAWLAGALPLLLLASTAAAETSYGVNSLACPANVETIGPDVDLSLPQFSTLNTTYLLRPGSYNITTTISVTNTSFPEGLCYIALEPNVTVYPKVSRSFTFNIGTRLGLQGFVLDGAQADGGVQTVAGSSAQWAAEGMTFQGFTNQAINLLGGTSSLRNCVVQNNSGRSRALVCQGGFTPQPNIVLSLETVSSSNCEAVQLESEGGHGE